MPSILALAALLASPLARAEEPAPGAVPEPSAVAAPAATLPVDVSITSVTRRSPIPADGLVLSTCAVPHGDPERGVPAGAVVLELRVRRGKVAMTTVTSADPAVAEFGPCFERELAAWQWPVRRDDVRVTVQVGDAPATAR